MRPSHKNSLWRKLEAISSTFLMNQFPAAFVVVFGISGFIEIAYTQSSENAAFEFVVAFVVVVALCMNRP